MIIAYKISEHVKSYSIKIPAKISMIRIDYATKRLLVSTEKEIYVIDKDKV